MFGCVYIPDFPVEAILRSEPELRARAVVVLAGRPPLEKVVALNEKARQADVEPGATRAQLEAWDALIFRARSEAQEHSAHAALLDCAQSFSPEIEDTAPDTVLLNLAGLEPLFGALPKIAHDLECRASQMGLEANVAVAANPDTALVAARGFPGVTLIPDQCEAERLGELPVDVLFETFAADVEQARRWLETFDRWGVRKLRALAALPEIPVSERLGQEGIRLQKLARGAVMRSLRLFEAQPVFEESVELEFPVVLLEPLAFLLNRLLEQVCARLSARALAAQELRLALELDPGISDEASSAPDDRTIYTRTLQLPVPMLDAKVFLKLLQLDLQAQPPGAPIVKIHLHAEPARPRTSQSGLFLPVFPEPEKLELTLARIAGIVGVERVGSAQVLDTHREGAFQMRHFAPAGPEIPKTEKKEW
jgi:protein ImuB